MAGALPRTGDEDMGMIESRTALEPPSVSRGRKNPGQRAGLVWIPLAAAGVLGVVLALGLLAVFVSSLIGPALALGGAVYLVSAGVLWLMTAESGLGPLAAWSLRLFGPLLGAVPVWGLAAALGFG